MRRALRNSLVTALVIALSGAGAVTASPGVTGAAPADRGSVDKPLWRDSQDYWTTLAAPRIPPTAVSERFNRGNGSNWFESAKARHSTGFPPAAQELARREAIANRTAPQPRSARRACRRRPGAAGPAADAAGRVQPRRPGRLLRLGAAQRPVEPGRLRHRARGHVAAAGPLHNQLPDPATIGTGRDNNTFWVPGLQRRSTTDKIIYSRNGLTAAGPARPPRRRRPARPDGPQLLPGDVEGRIRVHRQRDPLAELPHSEAWYSADSCEAGPASDIGHPDNPRGTGQMAIDAVEALGGRAARLPVGRLRHRGPGRRRRRRQPVRARRRPRPRGPRARRRRPGRRRRRPGQLRRVVQRPGRRPRPGRLPDRRAPAEASSTTPPRPRTPASACSRTSTATTSGLPDLYDVIGPTDTDVGFWDLMSTGSHSGPAVPDHPGPHGRMEQVRAGLGRPPGARVRRPVSRRAARARPRGRRAAPRTPSASTCPTKSSSSARRTAASNAWWTNNDQNDADVRLTRTIDVPAGRATSASGRGTTTRSRSCGTTASSRCRPTAARPGPSWRSFDEAGNLVSTDEDPNGNLAELLRRAARTASPATAAATATTTST